MGARDRSIRFVFDTVDESYASGRSEMPIEMVREAADAVGVGAGAPVLDLIGSMGYVAASGKRDALLAELGPILGDEPLELIDLIWSIAARRR